MKGSRIVSVTKVGKLIQNISRVLYEDQISIYASQATFFIIISAIPFLMLLLSLSRYIAPVTAEDIKGTIKALIPESAVGLVDSVLAELSSKSELSFISITAITTLWSASKGLAAVTRGISKVYGNTRRNSFLVEVFSSVFYTVMFIITIIITLIVGVFGEFLVEWLAGYIPGLSRILNFFVESRVLIFFIILTIFFDLIYLTVSRKGNKFGKKLSEASNHSPKGFLGQLPGAAFASAGWLLYTFAYSLYFHFFPSASYIYGSLAAIVFLMLWLYFCMMILMFGAEINKAIYKSC